jgi:hypothetical protein
VALGKLSALQERILIILAGLEPAWTLTGGGALVGFHSLHRETRDLDLFFRPHKTLEHLVPEITRRLESSGLTVQTLRSSATFSELQVRDAIETIEIDLVADPTPQAEPPRPTACGSAMILVDTPHQLLVNKLCALLSRSEVRDLVDVRALLEMNGDLARALEDAPRQDAGFSPLTFGWSVRGIPLRSLARSLGWADGEIAALETFRDELVERVVQAARPDP